MRKILSICVVLSVLLSFLCFPAATSAAVDGLVFELDLTNYNHTTGAGLKNSVTNSTNFTTNDNPQKLSFDTIFGTKYYLHFRDNKNDAHTNRRVEYLDRDVLNLQNSTIEFWGRVGAYASTDPDRAYIRPFAIAKAASDSASCEFMIADSDFFVRPGRTSAGAMFTDRFRPSEYYGNKWAHYVITRAFNAAGTSVVYEIYVNGVKLTDGCGTADAHKNLESDNDYHLYIGNSSSSQAMVGDIAEFRVYNKVLDAATIANYYNSSSSNFVQLADTLSVESVSLAEGDIPMNAGTLTVDFNNYLNKSTVDGNIYFVKANGDEILGKTKINCVGDYSKRIEIRYGDLEPGEDYKLVITPGLKSLNNKFIAGGAQYNYSVISNVLTELDFSEPQYVVGENLPEIPGYSFISDDVQGSRTHLNIRQTESGKKYLELSATQVTKNAKITYDFQNVSPDDIIVVESIIRPNGSTVARNVNEINGVGSNYGNMSTGHVVVKGTAVTGANSYDEDGFFHIEFKYEKDSSGKYSITARDLVDTTRPSVFVPGSDFNVGTLNKIVPTHLYVPAANADKLNETADLAYFKVYKTGKPEVFSTDFENYKVSENTTGILFNSSIDPMSLDDDSFKVTKADGTPVDAVYDGYSEANRTAYIKFNTFLDYNTEYRVEISPEITNLYGVNLSSGTVLTFTTPGYDVSSAATFTNEGGTDLGSAATVTDLNTNVTLTNNTSDAKNCMVTVIVYDATGRITNIETVNAVAAANTNTPVAVTNLGVNMQSGYSAELFVWDVIGGIMWPTSVDPITVQF